MGKNNIIGNSFNFKGSINVPADKSIGHRALFLAALNEGKMTEITNLALTEDIRTISKDIQSTINCLAHIGIQFAEVKGKIFVKGRGIKKLVAAPNNLHCENSGTTARLLMGLLSGQKFASIIDGDESLKKRPMKRVVEPLQQMGANINSEDNLLPIEINSAELNGEKFELNLGSAQVKTAIILAALNAKDVTTIKDSMPSRDHTEIMLSHFTKNLKVEDGIIYITPDPIINLEVINIPGDPSSAAFFIVGALINPGSDLELKNICLNPTRIHYIDILKEMGGKIEITNSSEINGELVGDIQVKSSDLNAIDINKESIPFLIDELPILSLACALASGKSKISGADELRYKESDRIKTTVSQLKILGVNIEETNDGMIIEGGNNLVGAVCESFGDHRIAMMNSIAGTIASGETTINESDSVAVSFPNFYELLDSFKKR